MGSAFLKCGGCDWRDDFYREERRKTQKSGQEKIEEHLHSEE